MKRSRMLYRALIVIALMTLSGFCSETAGVIHDKKAQDSFWEIYTNALRNDKVAQYQVGVMYERGIGVDQNQTEAALWYEKSAWQGYIDAQYNLALMNASGRGVEKNLDRAMIWLAKAARQGDKEARTLLLEIIDGKLDEKPKVTERKQLFEKDEELEPITPVTLITKDGAQVCTVDGSCVRYKEKTTFTSKSKQGKYYKISGMGTSQGWKTYEEDGWIDEESVVLRK